VKKKLLIAVIAVGGLGLMGADGKVWAGARSDSNVYVNYTSRYAFGSLGTARNSTIGNNYQYIGCNTESYANGFIYAECFAADASGNGITATRTDSNPYILNAIQNIKGDSYIEFDWDTNQQLTYIRVLDASYLAPKQL
jgi:hypothetical protein